MSDTEIREQQIELLKEAMTRLEGARATIEGFQGRRPPSPISEDIYVSQLNAIGDLVRRIREHLADFGHAV